MRELLKHVLVMAIGGTAFGIAYSTHERMLKHMEEDSERRRRETWDEAWETAFKSGERMAYDSVIFYARNGIPFEIKPVENINYTVTIKAEEVKD